MQIKLPLYLLAAAGLVLAGCSADTKESGTPKVEAATLERWQKCREHAAKDVPSDATFVDATINANAGTEMKTDAGWRVSVSFTSPKGSGMVTCDIDSNNKLVSSSVRNLE